MNDYTQKRLEFEKRLDTIIGGYSYAQDGGYGGYEFKDITDHIDTFIAQAEQEGYERGKLSEIENSAVGDIKIVSDKVEQIKAQAEQEMLKRVEQKLLHQKECIFLGIQKEFIKKALSSHRQRDY